MSYSIWAFIYKKGEARWTDIRNAFVPEKCANQTFSKAMVSLQAEGKIKKKISTKTNRPVYYVTK